MLVELSELLTEEKYGPATFRDADKQGSLQDPLPTGKLQEAGN